MTTETGLESLNVLTELEAQERAARVSDVAYALSLSLTKGAETYEGTVSVRFSLDDPAAGVFLDCTSKSINSLTLNGTEVDVRHERNRLYLDGADLSAENVIEIAYTRPHRRRAAPAHPS